MKLSELRGKTVITVAEARKIGSVDDVLVDPSFRRIEAVLVKPGGRQSDYFVATDQLRGIGPDAVTVVSQEAVQDLRQAPDKARLPVAGSVLNSRIVTERGEVLGTISEVLLDPNTYSIQAFEFTTGALGSLFGRQHQLDLRHLVGVGSGVVTVTEAARPSRAA